VPGGVWQPAMRMRARRAALQFPVGAAARSVLRDRGFRDEAPNGEKTLMRILQPAEWPKPRGFSHGVELDGPGRWIVLAGQTGGDAKGDYAPDLAAQVGSALRRIVKLLAEAGAGPEHIVRLNWYLTSRSEYEAAGAGIGAAWTNQVGARGRAGPCMADSKPRSGEAQSQLRPRAYSEKRLPMGPVGTLGQLLRSHDWVPITPHGEAGTRLSPAIEPRKSLAVRARAARRPSRRIPRGPA